MRITVELQVEVEAHQEGRWWIASCPRLDVASQGATEVEAVTNLEDALTFFVESCIERGTIFEVLREAGFAPLPAGEEPPADEHPAGLSLRVPLPFVVADQRDVNPSA